VGVEGDSHDNDCVRYPFRALEYRIIIKLGALMAFSSGVTATLVKLL
jgi:hypothetical protein